VLLIALAPSAAWALKPGKHRSLAEAACRDAQLPDDFCRRMGKQVYETDFSEWNDLSAHAQRERGQDRCAAADAAIARVDRLAREVVDDVHTLAYEPAAVALGRMIHTIQDECAHHGMSNEEHAFYSLETTCDGVDVSPDTQPAAIACAETRTSAAMQRIATALAGTSWTGVEQICRDFDNKDTCATAALPTPAMACRFLRLHKDWDGTDSTWHTTRVGDALFDAVANALDGSAVSRSLCNGDPHAIDPQMPRANVVDREAGCGLLDAICLGKVDEDGEPVPGASADAAGDGCAASHGSPLAALAVLAALLLARSRNPQDR
jgi:hypothetical protein